jgi:hypothetical protein
MGKRVPTLSRGPVAEDPKERLRVLSLGAQLTCAGDEDKGLADGHGAILSII